MLSFGMVAAGILGGALTGAASYDSTGEPVSPQDLSLLRPVFHNSHVSGFQSGIPWQKNLDRQALEISSPVIGGPAGSLLRISQEEGTIHARLRQPGDGGPGLDLPRLPAEYSTEAVFALPGEPGRNVHLYQSPVDEKRDLSVTVKSSHGLAASVQFRDGQTHRVGVSKGGDTVDARDGGLQACVSHFQGLGQYLQADTAHAGAEVMTVRMPPSGTLSIPVIQSAMAGEAGLSELRSVSHGLIAEMQVQFPRLA